MYPYFFQYFSIPQEWFFRCKKKTRRFDGKTFMGFRRKFSILVVLFLVAGFFANSALSEVCFCGQACLHVVQPKSKTNITFHMRCPGTLCKSCDLEESQTLSAISPVTYSFELNGLDIVLIQPLVNDYSFTNDNPILVQFNKIFVTVPSLSLYLHNLTFLC